MRSSIPPTDGRALVGDAGGGCDDPDALLVDFGHPSAHVGVAPRFLPGGANQPKGRVVEIYQDLVPLVGG